jgi:cytochrome c oxidase subunit 3
MIWAYIGAKRNNLNELKIALISTILLGLYFIQQQKNGWTEILNRESISQLSSSSSFFLIVTTIHVVHLTTGLIILFVTLVKTFDHRIHSKNMLPMDVCIYFWTFAIIIWLGFLIMYV